MNLKIQNLLNYLLIITLLLATPTWAFDSGSTGADGPFSPLIDITMPLPPGGIYNFTTVNIPAGVTIKFTRNATNSPVVILAQGDVVIDGDIDISGVDGGTTGIAPPGGYDGGPAVGPLNSGANGLGPGAGIGGIIAGNVDCGGAGAGYGSEGLHDNLSLCIDAVVPGTAYGSNTLQPLQGGSGGGSGNNRTLSDSSGAGGGGGGAMLIAATGSLMLKGQILASGGNGQNKNLSASQLGAGGGGSGGGVRLVATSLTGTGTVNVSGGTQGLGLIDFLVSPTHGSSGGYGRVRLEAETFSFTGTVMPSGALLSTGAPQPIFVPNIPTVRITMVGGRAVAAVPSGINDVSLPSSTSNPVPVEFLASNVPVGETVRLRVTPTVGAISTADSTPLSGTESSSTANADINLQPGASVLTASVNFSLSVVAGNQLSSFANGEQVAHVKITNTAGKAPTTVFTSISGTEYHWSNHMLASIQ